MALHQQAEVARAKLESELDARRAHPGGPVPGRAAAASPATSSPRATGRRASAAATTTTRCRRPGAAADERVLLCVADVSGKGLPAALVMSNMQATLRALLGRASRRSPRSPSARASCSSRRRPRRSTSRRRSWTWSRERARCRFVGAGHLDNAGAAGDRRGGAARRRRARRSGCCRPALPYAREAARARAPATRSLLFSDGVTEAQNAADEEFGEARLIEVLRGAPAQPRRAALIDRVFAGDRRVRRRRAAVRRHHDPRRAQAAGVVRSCSQSQRRPTLAGVYPRSLPNPPAAARRTRVREGGASRLAKTMSVARSSPSQASARWADAVRRGSTTNKVAPRRMDALAEFWIHQNARSIRRMDGRGTAAHPIAPR